jgi:hypothetical protein
MSFLTSRPMPVRITGTPEVMSPGWQIARDKRTYRQLASTAKTQKLRKLLFLNLADPALYSEPLDTLVDIGVPAEKEVIQ